MEIFRKEKPARFARCGACKGYYYCSADVSFGLLKNEGLQADASHLQCLKKHCKSGHKKECKSWASGDVEAAIIAANAGGAQGETVRLPNAHRRSAGYFLVEGKR